MLAHREGSIKKHFLYRVEPASRQLVMISTFWMIVSDMFRPKKEEENGRRTLFEIALQQRRRRTKTNQPNKTKKQQQNKQTNKQNCFCFVFYMVNPPHMVNPHHPVIHKGLVFRLAPTTCVCLIVQWIFGA